MRGLEKCWGGARKNSRTNNQGGSYSDFSIGGQGIESTALNAFLGKYDYFLACKHQLCIFMTMIEQPKFDRQTPAFCNTFRVILFICFVKSVACVSHSRNKMTLGLFLRDNI